MDDNTFRVSSALRLGGDICYPHKCQCGEDISSKAYHGLKCKKSAGRLSRHNQINDIISRALVTINVPNIREPLGCSRNDGKRPDGLTLIPWSKGKSLLWDFTCSDTFASSYIQFSSNKAGSVAAQAEDKKKAKYTNLMSQFSFKPIGIETMGVVGPEGKSFISNIGSRLNLMTGNGKAASFLWQRISIAIQRGNVASIMGTLPRGHHLDEIFLL